MTKKQIKDFDKLFANQYNACPQCKGDKLKTSELCLYCQRVRDRPRCKGELVMI